MTNTSAGLGVSEIVNPKTPGTALSERLADAPCRCLNPTYTVFHLKDHSHNKARDQYDAKNSSLSPKRPQLVHLSTLFKYAATILVIF